MKYVRIDPTSPEITKALASAPVFRKHIRVSARPAVPGEVIDTTLASGAKETTNTAREGDRVVTNPSGEQYLVSRETFLARYESTDEPGIYAATGFCRAMKNPFATPIEFMASWGALQVGNENCMIAIVCDKDGNIVGDPYIIDSDAFAETYA